MITRRLVIVSFILLATGTGLLAGYCNGSAGFDFSDALPGDVLKLNVTTTGYPMIFGFLLTVFGLVSMIVTFFGAIGGEIRALWPRPKLEKPSKLSGPEETAAD